MGIDTRDQTTIPAEAKQVIEMENYESGVKIIGNGGEGG